MAYLPNPYYGIVPGAPQALNFWTGPQFNMSGLPPPLPPPPPPPPLSPTVTPQDVAVRGVLSPDTGGAQPGGGGPGSGPGGIGGASGGGQDTTTSGTQGVYAQSPVDIDSRFGTMGGLLGAGAGSIGGIPGLGLGLGIGGAAIDAARYNGTLGQYGLPGHVSVPGSMASAALASIGIPFTNIDLAHLFGVPTARERMDAIINGLPGGLYTDQGYGAMAANAPHSPGAPFGNTGWGPGMNPTTGQFPPGFRENEDRLTIAANPEIFGAPAQSYAGMTPDARQSLDRAVANAIANNQDIFGTGAAPGGMSQSQSASLDRAVTDAIANNPDVFGSGDPTGGGSSSNPGGSAPATGGGTASTSGGDTGRDTGFFAHGGLIGAPPGRYAAGGAVRAASRMPGHYYPDVMMTPPRDYMSDADQRGAQGLAPTGQPGERGELSPREQAIQDFMDDLSIARQRDMFPDMLARGGAVGGLPPAAPGDNITPQQFGALRGINPPGPDDQIGALQTGEGVLTAKAVRAYPGLLEAANAGTLDAGRVKGLLTPAGMGRKPRLIR